MALAKVDFKKLGQLLLPTFLRKGALLALVEVIEEPLETVQALFRSNRESNLFDVNHNGQTCYLKSALDSLYDLEYANGFEIEDNEPEGEWQMIYNETEALADEHFIIADDGEDLLYDERDIMQPTNSFTVLVPSVAWDGDDERANYDVMRMTENFRLASRTAIYQLKS